MSSFPRFARPGRRSLSFGRAQGSKLAMSFPNLCRTHDKLVFWACPTNLSSVRFWWTIARQLRGPVIGFMICNTVTPFHCSTCNIGGNDPLISLPKTSLHSNIKEIMKRAPPPPKRKALAKGVVASLAWSGCRPHLRTHRRWNPLRIESLDGRSGPVVEARVTCTTSRACKPVRGKAAEALWYKAADFPPAQCGHCPLAAVGANTGDVDGLANRSPSSDVKPFSSGFQSKCAKDRPRHSHACHECQEHECYA